MVHQSITGRPPLGEILHPPLYLMTFQFLIGVPTTYLGLPESSDLSLRPHHVPRGLPRVQLLSRRQTCPISPLPVDARPPRRETNRKSPARPEVQRCGIFRQKLLGQRHVVDNQVGWNTGQCQIGNVHSIDWLLRNEELKKPELGKPSYGMWA